MTHTRHTAASPARPVRDRERLPAGGMTGRALRARVEPMTVRPLRDGRYVVETEGGTYVVDVDARTCTCPDHAIRGARCKHLRRVAIEITEGRVPPPQMRTAVCAVCGRETFAPRSATGPQLCDRHALAPGDVVRDRETGSLVVVTAALGTRADETETDEGRSVADYESNAAYGDHEPVVEAVYLDAFRPERDLGTAKRYRFPASRLSRATDTHGVRRPRRSPRPTTDGESGPEASSTA